MSDQDIPEDEENNGNDDDGDATDDQLSCVIELQIKKIWEKEKSNIEDRRHRLITNYIAVAGVISVIVIAVAGTITKILIDSASLQAKNAAIEEIKKPAIVGLLQKQSILGIEAANETIAKAKNLDKQRIEAEKKLVELVNSAEQKFARVEKIENALANSNLLEKLKDISNISEEFVLTAINDISFRQSIAAKVGIFPNGTIILSTVSCSQIQQGNWEIYEKAKGRFLVGTGTGKDVNKVSQTFTLGPGKKQEYEHKLIEKDLPEHTHSLISHPNRPQNEYLTRRGKYPAHEVSDSRHKDSGMDQTSGLANQFNLKKWGAEAGTQLPISNIPPYIALHFCIKTG
tara:strand:- start:2798 stop:3829 length:1032 start_codon:yes stop_codon:yes gene_type:complete